MDAYRTPEEENRSEAIQDASKHATEVSLETAEVCLWVLELAEPVTEKGNENAITDGGTGGHLAYAALQGALYNVQINLETIEDDEFIEGVEERAEEIEAAATEALPGTEGERLPAYLSSTSDRTGFRGGDCPAGFPEDSRNRFHRGEGIGICNRSGIEEISR